MKVLLIILTICFFCTGDDPPKGKNKKDTILIQQKQRSIDLDELNRRFDSINQKQDTLNKKK